MADVYFPAPDSVRRPLWVVLVVFLIALAGWIGAWGAAEDASLYQSIPVSFPFALHLIWNLGCALSFTLIGVGALRWRRWALRLTAPAVTAYAVLGLVLGGVFARAEYDQGRFMFQAATSLLVLIPLWWVSLRKGWIYPR